MLVAGGSDAPARGRQRAAATRAHLPALHRGGGLTLPLGRAAWPQAGDDMFTTFMFATGIENSIPTINNGRTRIDEMEKCGHYKPVGKGFLPPRRARYPGPALRPAAPYHLHRPGPLRLVLRRRDLRGTEAAQRHSDRRSLPFRRARLARKFPESRFSGAFRVLCRGFRAPLSLGPALHADQRDVRLRAVLGLLWLVERAADHRSVHSSRR